MVCATCRRKNIHLKNYWTKQKIPQQSYMWIAYIKYLIKFCLEEMALRLCEAFLKSANPKNTHNNGYYTCRRIIGMVSCKHYGICVINHFLNIQLSYKGKMAPRLWESFPVLSTETLKLMIENTSLHC